MLKKLNFFPLLLILLSACQTHLPIVSESISCDGSSERTELADTDYLIYANKMIDLLTQDKTVLKETSVNRLKLTFHPVENKTNGAIDITAVNRAIKNRLLRSGKFIVANDVISDSDYESGDYHLSGLFEEAIQQSDNCTVEYRQFSLKLMNTRTNRLLWSEKKIFQ